MNADSSATITESAIGAAFRVSNALGCGFLERVYENALAHEIRKQGLVVHQQRQIHVRYDGIVVGEYCADLLVENCVLIELKVVEKLMPVHRAQCIIYLRACDIPICLLLNFKRAKLEIERIVCNFRES